MKAGFSLWELTYTEFPVSLTGFGFTVPERAFTQWLFALKKNLSIIDTTQGVPGVSIFFFSQIELFLFALRLPPERQKLQKPSKLKKNVKRNPVVLDFF